MASRTRFVLDTSAVLALRSNEPGAGRVEALLRAARDGRIQVLLSGMTRMEILYRISCDEGADEAALALRLLDATRVSWVSCEEAILQQAARIKAGGGLSVADAWIPATAVQRDAVLVHQDPGFTPLRHVSQERLPS